MKEIICIICPRGCVMQAEVNDGEVTVTGNSCKRGVAYAESECISPVRTVTGVVRVANRGQMLSVKTSVAIPKEHIMELMNKISSITLDAPVHIGDIIIKDCYGCDVIATKNIL